MLRENIQKKLKEAQIAKDELTVGTLRLIMAAMKDRDIAARSKGNWDGIAEDEILSMMQSMIKQRHESVKMYEAGKRQDLMERELGEIKIIETFLPQQLGENEVKAIIDQAINALGVTSMKDMGKIMGELKAKYVGQMDFSKVSGLVKDRLSGK